MYTIHVDPIYIKIKSTNITLTEVQAQEIIFFPKKQKYQYFPTQASPYSCQVLIWLDLRVAADVQSPMPRQFYSKPDIGTSVATTQVDRHIFNIILTVF